MQIKAGDTVSVNFHNAQYTLCKEATVLYVPVEVGDTWIFKSGDQLHYVNETCTITKILNNSAPTTVKPTAMHTTMVMELADSLLALLKYAERNTCIHEETHRGGAIWEICDSCGMKWADDRGGKPTNAHELPEVIQQAAATIFKYEESLK